MKSLKFSLVIAATFLFYVAPVSAFSVDNPNAKLKEKVFKMIDLTDLSALKSEKN